MHQYIREGPIPLWLVLAALLASVGSATLGLIRNCSGFIDNFLVEMTVIGAGVVVTNIVIAGLQRGHRAQSAKPVLDRLAANLAKIADMVMRSVGLQSEELLSGISGSNVVDRLCNTGSRLTATTPFPENENSSVLVSEAHLSLVGECIVAAREQVFQLQELEPNLKLNVRFDELAAEVEAWKTRAYVDLRGGPVKSLRTSEGLKNVERTMKALQELAEQALRPFSSP